MEHKKVVRVKAIPQNAKTTTPEVVQNPNIQPMYIFKDHVSVYVTIRTLEQCHQYEVATDDVERRLFEVYGVSSLEICSDLTSIVPKFNRYLTLRISLEQIPVLLEEYAKKYYLFEYDVVFDYGTSADVASLDKDQYSTIAKIDRRVVGEEAFKAIARLYIGEDADISDIGYIQIQAPIVEYGK